MILTTSVILDKAVKFSSFTEDDMAEMLDADLEDVRERLTHLYTASVLEVYLCSGCNAIHYKLRKYAA